MLYPVHQKLKLIDEHHSPLFRLMWVNGQGEPSARSFENNICAFHIGNGYLLSVAHNLRTEADILRAVPASLFQYEVFPLLRPEQVQLFQSTYIHNPLRGTYHLPQGLQPQIMQQLAEAYRGISFDRRWITLMQKGISRPSMIVQFRNSEFYGQPHLTRGFSADHYMHEPMINRHTFLLEVELVKAWYNQDIALYKMTTNDPSVISAIPSIDIDTSVIDQDVALYSLQSAPQNELGRMLNTAHIEGYLDQFSFVPDRVLGNYIMEGPRYLIKGYFRFGSSGAPYLYYNESAGTYVVNAIQSEACPIQLSISNNRNGNYQYVSAIATPLHNIASELEMMLK